MLNTLLVIAGTAPAIVIAILAWNKAAKAEELASQPQEVIHTVELRHVRVNRSELPPLPDFMQPRRLALPDFIQQPKGEPPHAN